MGDQFTDATSKMKPGGRTGRIFADEAYRRVVAGDAPGTLSEFAAQLSDWFKHSHAAAPAVPKSFIEEAIRDTWHRRHELIGSEL